MPPADVTDPAAYPVLLPHPIRYNDTDRQGHVNNAAFATYFEVGRTEFFHVVCPDVMPDDCEPVLARLEIDYRAELHYPATIEVGIAVQAVGGSSLRLAQAVFRQGACAASGTSVVVQIETATRRPRRWSEAQRALLARYMLGAASRKHAHA